MTRTEYVLNALETRHGITWSADVEFEVEKAIAVADGKDTARKIAKEVAAKLRSAA